jgi:competence protein ComFB
MAVIMMNYMEEIVRNNLDNMLERMDGCTCEICKMDVMAIALNNLKPAYVASEKGVLYSRINDMEIQMKADVTTAIADAVQTVKRRPRHH